MKYINDIIEDSIKDFDFVCGDWKVNGTEGEKPIPFRECWPFNEAVARIKNGMHEAYDRGQDDQKESDFEVGR